MKKNIIVYYTYFDQEIAPSIWQKLIQQLPIDQQRRNARYVRWQDRHAHLLGRLLLAYGLNIEKLGPHPLKFIQYNAYSRPYIRKNIDFNISHSKNYVVCAIGKDVKLGVDIEYCSNVSLDQYRDVMTSLQWTVINEAVNTHEAFFRYWTIKEAVIKADGRGHSFSINEIRLNDNYAFIENIKWYLYPISIGAGYQSWLACNNTLINIVLKELNLAAILDSINFNDTI